MGPAMQRIRDGVAIRNPLLAQIKKDYELLFHTVRQGIDATIHSINVPDEEIGYVVMHFGASMERMQQFPRNIRAVLVCTSGIGSSKLLAVRITKELPQIDLIGHLSWYEAARLPAENYDLIISTVDLPLPADQYIKLSPLMTREETEKLRAYIQDITLKKLPPISIFSRSAYASLERIRLMKVYAGEVVQLLDRFEINELDLIQGESELEAVLTEMISIVGRSGVLEQVETIVQQLLERETHGSQVIPDTELALFHTRSEWIRYPILLLFRLSAPLLLGKDKDTPVKQILLMLGPVQLGKQSLEVLSEISAALLLPETIELLAAEDAESIKDYFSQQLETYIKTTLDWRDE
jgi:mannitol operon transcriptional antiterminator